MTCQDQFSSWKEMRSGIPDIQQGSTLGYLLFLVYMNTLPSIINTCTFLQYADSTTLICSAHGSAFYLSSCCDELSIVTDPFLVGW